MYDCPEGVERLMITPGTAKYERLHQSRPELLTEYDLAVEKHSAFLFIGFGFNDSQLCTGTIVRKLKEQKCPALIITRDNNPKITRYLKECENLWLVCKSQESGNEWTSIMNSRYQNVLSLNDSRLWDTAEFGKKILGG